MIRSTNYAIELKVTGSENGEMIGVPEVYETTYNLLPVGLDHIGREPLKSFLIDPNEVSNREFKLFLDAGGYQNHSFWKHPFILDGREVSWEVGIPRFVDKTGRQGPATWEVQDYPDGQEDYPVTGVSWYAAAAYAKFIGRELPTVFHWAQAASIFYSNLMVPASNLNGTGPSARGDHQGLSHYGTFDMAGNAREWVFNDTGDAGERYILGGGWNDPDFGFTDAFAQGTFDRSVTNGFRYMVYLDDNPNRETLVGPLSRSYRDYYVEEPVDDAEFAGILRQYAYDKTPLNETIEETDQTAVDWTLEKVTFDAAYGNERVIAYVFIPKQRTSPYQTVIFSPGSGSISRTSSEGLTPGTLDFFVKSGRIFVWPIYKGTHERGTDLVDDYGEETLFYKDHVIMWAQDLQRTVDYVVTREDVDPEKLAFFGFSWGAANGPIMTALETRFKASILYVPGLYPSVVLPEADPFNFLPRSTLPTLILNGKYDFFFPYESTQIPFVERLGTLDEHKEFYLSEGGHNVPREELISRSLMWLDRYLGPVK